MGSAAGRLVTTLRILMGSAAPVEPVVPPYRRFGGDLPRTERWVEEHRDHRALHYFSHSHFVLGKPQ